MVVARTVKVAPGVFSLKVNLNAGAPGSEPLVAVLKGEALFGEKVPERIGAFACGWTPRSRN